MYKDDSSQNYQTSFLSLIFFFFLHVFLLFTLTIFVTLLHSLAAGTFIPAKTDLPHVEKAAVVKFLRANGKLTVDESGKVLLFDNKIVSTKNLR